MKNPFLKNALIAVSAIFICAPGITLAQWSSGSGFIYLTNSNNKVVVGNSTAPTQKLEVRAGSLLIDNGFFYMSRMYNGTAVNSIGNDYTASLGNLIRVGNSSEQTIINGKEGIALIPVGTNNRVGIGNIPSLGKLDVSGDEIVRGDGWVNGEDAKLMLGDQTQYIRAVWGGGLRLATFSSANGGSIESIFLHQEDGNVGIGTPNPGSFKLAVEGKIGAREIVVTTAAWADHVFKPNYNLKPLDDVEKFIKTNNHLEGIPTAKEVLKKGVAVGDMQVKLLQKVEELTLYVIEQNKKIEQLKAELKARKN